MSENNNTAEENIKIIAEDKFPWSLSQEEIEMMEEYKIKPKSLDKSLLENMKKTITTEDQLLANYYEIKDQTNKFISERAATLTHAKKSEIEGKDSLVIDVFKQIVNFLYGEYENPTDRLLPQNAIKESKKTQEEFINFTEELRKKMIHKINDYYEEDKKETIKQSMIQLIQLKLLYLAYHYELFEKNKVIKEGDVK